MLSLIMPDIQDNDDYQYIAISIIKKEMKSFVNEQPNIVSQAIQGHLCTSPNLMMLDNFPQIKVVARKNWDKLKVALITGGGSGHEPAHVGYIGQGMLTAAVCGEIFASPSVDAVLSAILALTGQMGCLLIVKNYTGDRLNFGLAAEQARALGFKVEMVIVGDDISIAETKRKRGIAGTVFIHKIAGYYSQIGSSLSQIAKITKRACQKIFSIGLSISEHSLYSKPKPQRLTQTQAELGLGIHGEPGAKVIDFQKADTLMNVVAEELMKSIQKDEGKQYMMMLNNLGFVTPIEMDILMHGFCKTTISKVVKYVVGPGHFMTALNMSGFSLSIVEINQETEKALLYKVDAPGWKEPQLVCQPSTSPTPVLPKLLAYKASQNEKHRVLIQKISNLLISLQEQINGLDSIVGDADTGTTLCSIGRTLLQYLEELPLNNLKQLFESVGKILARQGGGSIGVLLSIFFIASANSYGSQQGIVGLGKCFLSGLKKMEQYGGAGKGSRTMVDALEPAFEKMVQNGTLEEIAFKAKEGAESTKKISKTQFGRSSYVPSELLVGAIDPGAYAVSKVFDQIAKLEL